MIKKKILLDTDIGSDIDDAVCLAYLLSNPECEIVGITTVSGEPVERAKLASCLCNASGKPDIPIYPGSAVPLLTESIQKTAPQSSVLKKYAHRESFDLSKHIQFMIDTIRANPHEITLLAIGPMTNVALLFATDPEIPSLLKEFVCMAGVFGKNRPFGPSEWNVRCDPYAAAVVYNADVKVHKSVGLDVTLQVRMDLQEVKKRFTKGILPVVYDMAKVWFENKDFIIFHDPLAAVDIFEDVCTYTSGDAFVDTDSRYYKGAIYFEPKENGRHQIAQTVDTERFFDSYFKYF